MRLLQIFLNHNTRRFSFQSQPSVDQNLTHINITEITRPCGWLFLIRALTYQITWQTSAVLCTTRYVHMCLSIRGNAWQAGAYPLGPRSRIHGRPNGITRTTWHCIPTSPTSSSMTCPSWKDCARNSRLCISEGRQGDCCAA
jgi:hypothetical protein